MLNLRLRSRGDPPGNWRSTNRRRTRLRVRRLILATTLVTAMLPASMAAAEPVGSDKPAGQSPIGPVGATEYRYVEVYIEGQEPYTLLSGKNVSMTQARIDTLVQSYLSSLGIAGEQSLQSRGYVTCDRRTLIWEATFPTQAVVGRVQVECFGNFDWVQLTGTLRIAEAWSPDRQVAWGQKTSSNNFELMLVTPRAECDSDDIELWRARNDVLVRFHSGERRSLLRRETPWYLYECSA